MRPTCCLQLWNAEYVLPTALERDGGISPSSLQTQGLTFASVHDSYWTHPSTIDQMSTIIRETFIALHSSDVLGRLLNEVTCSYPTSYDRHSLVALFAFTSSASDTLVTKSRLPR